VAAAYLTDPVAMTRPCIPMPRHCLELRDVWLKYFTASSLKDIFESVDNQNIIGFINDAHFYLIINCSTRYQYFIVAIKP